MKNASSWILLLFVAVAIGWLYAWHELADAAQNGYTVVYEQDFSDGDAPDVVRVIGSGDEQVIPPSALHHVVLDGPVRFAVEFYR